MISVLLPVKNGGQYLTQAINSLQTQSYRHFECWVIDDHSSDGASQLLLGKISRIDPRFKLIKNNGTGIIDALNTGLQQAKQPFIARMDADDIAHPQRFEKQLDYLQQHPEVDFCATKVAFFSEQSTIQQGLKLYQDWINSLCEQSNITNNMFVECTLPHPSFMLRRQVFEKIGVYQDHGWPEDYDLVLRAYIAGLQFGKPADVLLQWRDHPQRLSRTESTQQQRYSKQQFFAAKAHYFAQSAHAKRNIIIWGASKTGTLLQEKLQQYGITTQAFLDVNPRLIGNNKHGIPVYDAMQFVRQDELILLAVGTRGIRQKMITHLSKAPGSIKPPFIAFA